MVFFFFFAGDGLLLLLFPGRGNKTPLRRGIFFRVFKLFLPPVMSKTCFFSVERSPPFFLGEE